jgi:hypothetical protein
MRRNPFLLIAGFMMLLFMTGCPYDSPVPLSDPCKVSIDPDLAGTWVSLSLGSTKDTLEIINFNSHEYYIEFQNIDKNGIRSVSRGRGFVTMIRNQRILNFCELGNTETYSFFKYEIREKRMVTFSPSDKFITQTFSSSDEFFDFYKKNMDKQGFYEPPDTLVRVK